MQRAAAAGPGRALETGRRLREAPRTAEEAARVLAQRGRAPAGGVRIAGGGTKLGWGGPVAAPGGELSTAGMDRILEHNAEDLTAVVEAGVPLPVASAAFAESGQMLALDPPTGGGRATIGGILATGDSGPLRHRYGGARDLVLGMRVALPDGTVARSGGKVIKNVAGYDLVKLFTGSYGTLGVITEVVVRLHPVPARRVTVLAASPDPDVLKAAAVAAGSSPLELEALDLDWDGTNGTLLARLAGVAPEARARRASALVTDLGLAAEIVDDDEPLWERQRGLQRAAEGAVVKVAAVRTELARVVEAARAAGAPVTGRAGLGLFWIRLPQAPAERLAASVRRLRASLGPRPCVVLDAPEDLRDAVDVWGPLPGLAVMRRLKERFDPAGVCNPGVFAGGI